MIVPSKKVPNKEKEELPRSMRPIIPEPKHRIAPKGVSSGISFRNLPAPSLSTIKKICEHYESKCSGQYNSLASRYVLQMGQEIRSQIEGMDLINKPQHFTFDESIKNTFDKIYTQGESYYDQDELQDPDNVNNRSSAMQTPPKKAALERRIKKLEEKLLEKETELKIQKEKAAKDLKYCEQQYKEKNQVDRLHFENSQRLLKSAHGDETQKLKKEISQVKSDARLVIDFIRRKANEAIADENSKIQKQKNSIGKKMEELQSEMKKTFHNHLCSLEEEVIMVVKKEKKKAVDLKILPPPPPKNIIIFPKHKPIASSSRPFLRSSIPTDESEAPNLCSDDSISTCYSDEIPLFVREKRDDQIIMNEHDLLRSKVQELEEWTDTLTLALRTGAKLKGPKSVNKRNIPSKKSTTLRTRIFNGPSSPTSQWKL